jgi:hypothetical protein
VINEAIWPCKAGAAMRDRAYATSTIGWSGPPVCPDPPARPDEIARRISPSNVLTRPLRSPFLRPDLSLMHASARPNTTRRHPSPWPGCHPPLHSNSQNDRRLRLTATNWGEKRGLAG